MLVTARFTAAMALYIIFPALFLPETLGKILLWPIRFIYVGLSGEEAPRNFSSQLLRQEASLY